MILQNGEICDYSKREKSDIRIQEGKISHIGKHLTPEQGEEVIDCSGKVILPALIDMAYPKNKSLSFKNLDSLCQKALSGGVGTILLRPDTTPSIDHEAIIELVRSLDSNLAVHFIPSIMPYKDGKMSEISSLVSCGAYAIATNAQMEGYALYKIAQYANMLHIPIIISPQEASLSDGVMNEGAICSLLGLNGIPQIAQTIEVAKLSEMARFSKAKVVFDVISEIPSLQITQSFKQMGAQILAQTSIHHLILTHESCLEYDTRVKLFPPLKDKETKDFLLASLTNDIDMLTCLQSDSYKSLKDQVFDNASFGINAIHFYFSLGYEFLVKPKIITLERLSFLTSYAQATLLGLNKGEIAIAKDADLIIVDLDSSIQIQDSFSPYDKKHLQGKVQKTLINGKIVAEYS